MSKNVFGTGKTIAKKVIRTYNKCMNNITFKNITLNLVLALQATHEKDWYESKNNEYYDLWVVTEGEFHVEYQGTSYLLQKYDAFLFYPDILCKTYSVSDKCSFLFLHFDAMIGTNHHALHLFPSDGFISRKSAFKELSLLRASFTHYSKNEPFSELLLIGSLMTVLSRQMADKLNQPLPLTDSAKTRPTLSNLNPVFIYINHHIMEPISIHELARIANLSEQYFIQYFKKAMGVTPASYVNDLKMKIALELVSKNKYSVKEISQKLGYAAPYTFSKAFKRTYGVAPTKIDF